MCYAQHSRTTKNNRAASLPIPTRYINLMVMVAGVQGFICTGLIQQHLIDTQAIPHINLIT